ncbi:MAG: hypothetical protein DME04_24060 [Candidatus Rokuibacteriota bacterium]|nr:MAG: hypothetical protein DME04_24060 [Candidatus Rokubacteria bacterium]
MPHIMVTLGFMLLSLCTWLAPAAYASGPGEPFKLSALCACLLLALVIILVFVVGWLLGQRRNRQP